MGRRFVPVVELVTAATSPFFRGIVASWNASVHVIMGRDLDILGTSGLSSYLFVLMAFHCISKFMIMLFHRMFTAVKLWPKVL